MSNAFDHLTNDELRSELIARGINAGPINHSTRATYIKKLIKLGGSGDASFNRESSFGSPPRRSSAASKRKSSPRRVSPLPRRSSPPTPVERFSPSRRVSPPPQRRVSPPPQRRVSPPAQRSPPRVNPQSTISQYSPPRRISPPPSPKVSAYVRPSPAKPYRRGSPNLPSVSKTFGSSVPPNKVDFDDSALEDDHMEFSKYIPRAKQYSPYSGNRTNNSSFSTSFLDDTKRQIRRIKVKSTPVEFFLAGLLLAIAAGILYCMYPTKIEHGFSKTIEHVLSVVTVGFNAVIILAVLAALGFAGYKVYQIRQKQKIEHDKKKQQMIKKILKAVYTSSRAGVPVKQLRDRMIPPYSRSTNDLMLWNECEDFVKNHDTRVRAEERALSTGDEIVEHFVWVGQVHDDEFQE